MDKRKKHQNAPLAIGDRVLLDGLKTSDYNGMTGKITSLPKKGVSKEEARYGVLVDGQTKPIAIRLKNIHRSTTEKLCDMREQYQSMSKRGKEEYMSAEQLTMMRKLKDMVMTEEMQIKAYGRKIHPLPNFYEELVAKGIPIGVDPDWAKNTIRLSFEQSSNLPHMLELAFKRSEHKHNPKDIIKRLNGTELSKLEWYCGKKEEHNFIFKRQINSLYAPFNQRHSFSNESYQRLALHRGTTHVAVGFVDLGVLLSADILDPPSSSHTGGPLKFVGVEMSAYQIAKTLVMWELFNQFPLLSKEKSNKKEHDEHICHVRAIIQAWFSSTWDKATEEYVLKAIVSVNKSSATKTFHSDIQKILNHWANANRVSLQEARSKIAESSDEGTTHAAHLLRKKDRIALMEYELTKDFCVEKEHPHCGNLLMFNCPDGTPPVYKNETIFSAFLFMDIMKVLVESSGARKGRTKLTIMNAAENYAMEKVKNLVILIKAGHITMELLYGDIQKMTDLIASKHPWTMSWSNVSDYFELQEFHRIARSCSRNGDTIHFGYSMNWASNVFGASLIDYQGQSEILSNIIDVANQTVDLQYKRTGWDSYFRSPPPENPINTVGTFCLGFKFHKEWSEFFFQIAERDGPCQVCKVERNVGSPLSFTGCNTIYFAWTYDSNVRVR